MHPLDFCYWLHGYAELNGKTPDDAQWKMIKEHLATVFEKRTPVGPWEDKTCTQQEQKLSEVAKEIKPTPTINIDEILKKLPPKDEKSPTFVPASYPPFIPRIWQEPYIINPSLNVQC